MMNYRVLSKNDSGEYELTEKEVFRLPLAMIVNPSKDAIKIDNSFKTALEIVSRWKIEERIFKLTGKLDKLMESTSSSVNAVAKVNNEIETLKKLVKELPTDSEKPEPWFMYLAYAIEKPGFMNFKGGKELVNAINTASDNNDFKAVRDALLEFGKNFAPTSDSGIKSRKPSFRLNNPHDGRYSIEELVNACTARKRTITRNGASYKEVKKMEVLYTCLAEIFRECYGIPVSAKKAKQPKFEREA